LNWKNPRFIKNTKKTLSEKQTKEKEGDAIFKISLPLTRPTGLLREIGKAKTSVRISEYLQKI